MKRRRAMFLVTALLAAGTAAAGQRPEGDAIDRGRYLVRIGGCNDCHTPGYVAERGRVPESRWLVGSPVGYPSVGGPAYASSLRAALAPLSESQWLTFARLERRPPMPWTSLQAMSDQDLRAVYRFIRSLGAP